MHDGQWHISPSWACSSACRETTLSFRLFVENVRLDTALALGKAEAEPEQGPEKTGSEPCQSESKKRTEENAVFNV